MSLIPNLAKLYGRRLEDYTGTVNLSQVYVYLLPDLGTISSYTPGRGYSSITVGRHIIFGPLNLFSNEPRPRYTAYIVNDSYLTIGRVEHCIILPRDFI